MSQPTKQHWQDNVLGRPRPDDPNPVACGRRVPKTSALSTAKFRNVETARRCKNCNEALYQADLIYEALRRRDFPKLELTTYMHAQLVAQAELSPKHAQWVVRWNGNHDYAEDSGASFYVELSVPVGNDHVAAYGPLRNYYGAQTTLCEFRVTYLGIDADIPYNTCGHGTFRLKHAVQQMYEASIEVASTYELTDPEANCATATS